MTDRRPARLVAITLAALVAAPVSLASRPAVAQTARMNPEAQLRYDRGLEYYKLKEYEAAIQELEAAYEIDPRPEILFSVAQAERLSGDCESAALLYRRFLDTNPAATHADAARASLERCETALASRPKSFAKPESADERNRADAAPAAPVVRSPVAPPAAPPAPRPFWKDPLGGGLAGGGLVALGLGATFFTLSASDARAADEAATLSRHQHLYDQAERRRTIAWVGLGAGAALVAGAVLRWTLVDGDREHGALTVHVSTGPELVGLGLAVIH